MINVGNVHYSYLAEYANSLEDARPGNGMGMCLHGWAGY